MRLSKILLLCVVISTLVITGKCQEDQNDEEFPSNDNDKDDGLSIMDKMQEDASLSKTDEKPPDTGEKPADTGEKLADSGEKLADTGEKPGDAGEKMDLGDTTADMEGKSSNIVMKSDEEKSVNGSKLGKLLNETNVNDTAAGDARRAVSESTPMPALRQASVAATKKAHGTTKKKKKKKKKKKLGHQIKSNMYLVASTALLIYTF